MAGFTMITNDEYKELIVAQCDSKNYEDAFHEVSIELKETREKLDALLLYITKGATHSKWEDGKFESFDLARDFELADYINKYFMKNGRLTVKENNND